MFGTRWAIVHRDQTFSEPLTRALEDVPRTAGSFASLLAAPEFSLSLSLFTRTAHCNFFCAFPPDRRPFSGTVSSKIRTSTREREREERIDDTKVGKIGWKRITVSEEIKESSIGGGKFSFLRSLHRVCTRTVSPPPPIVTISKRSVNKGSN